MPSFKNLALLAAAATTSFAHSQDQDDKQKAIVLGESCRHPPYKTHMVSKSPLVIYISDFLTAEERDHLVDITRDTFTRSEVTVAENEGPSQREIRTSQSTNVPRDDVVRCIEERARLFQGFDVPRSHLEPVQLVRYATGEHYYFHTDWFTHPVHYSAASGGNRVSSFFAYVAADNITGGGTNFPIVDAPVSERWCEYVDCNEPWDNGVTFRPVVGNAVFWQNLYEDGSGDERNMHAGLPVTSGWKIGMNIWTRQGPLSEDVRGPE